MKMNNSSYTHPPAFFRHNHDNLRKHSVVTRSSAVFYFARRDDFRTQILFLNYWHEKRGISDITMRLTLRSMDGTKLLDREIRINDIGGHIIEINNLLDSIEPAPEEGSIEIEFLSNENMAIAYPAAIVRYLGARWHTVAHASQRYYSSESGDDVALIGQIQTAEEGNITILNDLVSEPFVILHNGATSVEPTSITISIFAANGRTLSVSTPPIGWGAFQTRVLYLREFVDYRAFLGEQVGTFTLKFLIAGVFPRLIGGFERDSVWSIDHTNFSATIGPATADLMSVNGRQGFKDLVFNIPNNCSDGWECFADIYPTYPSGEYTIEVYGIDRNGGSKELALLPIKDNGKSAFQRISINSLAENIECNIELVYRHEQKLPRRFHTGIHYSIGDGLPGFLTDGPLPHSTAPVRTRWFPVFEPTESRNFLMVSNRTIGNDVAQEITYSVKLFDSFGTEKPLLTTFVLAAYESCCVSLETLFPEAESFLNDRPGWIYMTADKPQRSVFHYASVRGDNSIAVDHAF